MQQDIGDFEITMHSIDLMQPSKTVQNLFEEGSCLVFSKSLLFEEVIFEIAAIAKLHRDKLRALRGETINKLDDVFVIALPQNPDLGSDEFFEFGSLFHEDFRYGLDCDIGYRGLVKGFIDYGPGALA